MVSIRRKILYKGSIVQEQLLNVLQRHEDSLVDGSSSSTISDLQTTVGTLDTEVNGTNQEGTLAYKVEDLVRRVKALEDAE